MQAALEGVLPYIADPAERAVAVWVDPDTGYGYSPDEGLWKLTVLAPDVNGIVRRPDGTSFPLPPEGRVPLGRGTTDYRLVLSVPGYVMADGWIRLPDFYQLVGVDEPSESAYNYFGLERGQRPNLEYDYEGGIFTQGGMGSIWYVFLLIGSWIEPHWPPGGILPGSTVYLKLSIPTQGVMSLYVWTSTRSRSFHYIAPYTRPLGEGQVVRRNTSLFLNDFGAMIGTHWTEVGLMNGAGGHGHWTVADTASTETTEHTTVFAWHPYYDETIDITLLF